MCGDPVLFARFSVSRKGSSRSSASLLSNIRELVLVVVLVAPLIFWCRGLQWLPTIDDTKKKKYRSLSVLFRY
jgi:hypothetical protein